jgi:excisionase family DNA binding protein
VAGESAPGEEPLLLTVRDVCRLLNRSRARVYEMVRMREIGHLRDGRSVLIPREALDEWIRRKRRQSGC